jgi:hypothetical protein
MKGLDMKKVLSTFFLFLLLCGISFAQWTNTGAFPDASVQGQLHGIAVDPDGKIWVANFGTESFTPPGASAPITVRLIRVYNPDGSQASFSPIWRIVGPTLPNGGDTLTGSNSRGMRPDHNGNILYVDGGQRMYRINYQTGEGMNKIALGLGTSPTAPAVSADGKIFVGPVVNAGYPILEFDKDFNLVGQAVPPFTVSGFSRSMECSADGNTLYFPSYSRGTILVYSRPDELSAFDSVGTIMDGVDCESITFNKATGKLWIASGSYNDLPDPPYSPGLWYEYDVATASVTNYIAWQFSVPFSAAERPRGIDFSPDGQTAYFGCFGGSGYPLVQKATFAPWNITDYKVTVSVDMGVQAFEGTFDPVNGKVVIRGDFQNEAGDAGGDWQGDYFEMTDTDGDTIYTYTISMPLSEAGKTFNYKYVIQPGNNWESTPNRQFTLNFPEQSLPKVWFNDDKVYTVVNEVTNTIEFTADISNILGVGVGGAFDSNQDSLLVMGLDWDNFGKDVTGNRRLFNTDPFNNGIYTTTLTVTSGSAAPNGVGDSTKWKFRAFPDTRFGNTGWETGTDRWHYYVADGQTVTLDPIVPRIYPLFGPLTVDVPVQFNVDLTGAVNAKNGLPIPVDQVEWVGIKGAATFLGSWGGSWTVADTLGGDASTLKVLHKVSGNIWRYDVLVPAGTNSGAYEYKYAAYYPGADTVAGGSTPLDNEGGFGVNHLLLLTDKPSGIVMNNIFGNFTTGIEKLDDVIPAAYQLDQNYPNPFNPSTTIRYSIPEAGLVTVKVFNLLGQEVATLVNTQQATGAYEVSFDASQLSSGIYFYSIEVNNFTATKKMILMK